MRNLSLVKADSVEGISFALEKVYSLQSSLCLIKDSAEGLSAWVTRMRQSLSTQELEDTKSFCGTNTYLEGRGWDSIDQWLDHVNSLSDEQMVSSTMAMLRKKLVLLEKKGIEVPSDQVLLDSEDEFVRILSEFWKAEDFETDEEFMRREHFLLTHPGEKRTFITSFFQSMYDRYLREEWERQEQDLLDTVRAFSSINFQAMDRRRAVTEILQRPQMDEEMLEEFEKARQIIFIPSAHIGPYLMIMDDRDGVMRVIHGARIPEGAVIKSPSLLRAELLLKLEAVADDHRLRILRIIADRGEVSSQEIIDSLNLSQSSVSRHLKQLTANGFTTVRSIDRSKFFSLNMNRFDTTFQSLKRYLGG